MNKELLRNKKLLYSVLSEAAVLSLAGTMLIPLLSDNPTIKYVTLICLSIPLFYTFSVLKYSSMREKSLKKTTKRMLLFLLIFAALLVICGLLSGIAAVAIYSTLKTSCAVSDILVYISYASACITCLLYPFLPGFFSSLTGEKNFFREGIKLTLKRYFVLLVIAILAFAIGWFAANIGNYFLKTAISAVAGTGCLILSLAVIPGQGTENREDMREEDFPCQR